MTVEKAGKEPGLIAVVRLRGKSKASKEVNDTLEMLHLTRANHCAVVPDDKTYNGMLKRAGDFVAWGGVDEDTLIKLLEKRGFGMDGKRLDAKHAKSIAHKALKAKKLDDSGINPVFRLSPPSGGLRSVKTRYPRGDLGPRGGTINELLSRMI